MPYCSKCNKDYQVLTEYNRTMLRCDCGVLVMYANASFKYIPKNDYDKNLSEKNFEKKTSLFHRKLSKNFRDKYD